MAAKKELMEALHELHRVSVEMDQLTSRAEGERTSEMGAELVRVVGRWVGLVEGFVQYCPPGEKLVNYQQATRGLEDILQGLDGLNDVDEIRGQERRVQPAVDRWSEALTEVINEVLGAASR